MDQPQPIMASENSLTLECDVLGADPSRFSMMTERNQRDFSQYGSTNVYDKPGLIINRDLLRDGRNNYLKESLIEHYDYEAVSQQVWTHLYSWYSADWCISREIKRDKFNSTKIYLDLYPEDNLDESEMDTNQEPLKYDQSDPILD